MWDLKLILNNWFSNTLHSRFIGNLGLIMMYAVFCWNIFVGNRTTLAENWLNKMNKLVCFGDAVDHGFKYYFCG